MLDGVSHDKSCAEFKVHSYKSGKKGGLELGRPSTGHSSENLRSAVLPAQRSALRRRAPPAQAGPRTPRRGVADTVGRSSWKVIGVPRRVTENLSGLVERAHASLFPLNISSERSPGAQSKSSQHCASPSSPPAASLPLSLCLSHSSQQNIRAGTKKLLTCSRRAVIRQ